MNEKENWEYFLGFEKDYELPKDFFKNLYYENDWSFVIKIHSLLESVISSLILYHLNEPSIGKIISRLELSNPKTGKIAFLKSLKLVGESNQKFISSFSQLRNNLVHKVENISFSFDEWISKMDKNQLKQNAITFSPYESVMIQINKKAKARKKQGLKYLEVEELDLNMVYERFRSNTKDHIWFGLHNLLVNISEAKGYSDYLQERKYSEFLYDFDIED
jgi:hypothetical protein